MRNGMKNLIAISTLAILVSTNLAHGGETLWGVTISNYAYPSPWWTGGEIFTVDTSTGAVSVKALYDNSTLLGLGDIAVNPNGEVYVTYYASGSDGFDQLAKVNTSTWGFDWVQDLGGWNDQINALDFIGGTLYGVTGGGIPADVIEFALTPTGATATNHGNIGINSTGDLAEDFTDGTVYYTSGWNIPTVLNTVDLAAPAILTSVVTDGWGLAGLEFTSDGTLWSGSYLDQNLYTMNKSTGAATVAFNLAADLNGTITGLSNPIPAPSAILLGSLGVGLVGWLRTRSTL